MEWAHVPPDAWLHAAAVFCVVVVVAVGVCGARSRCIIDNQDVLARRLKLSRRGREDSLDCPACERRQPMCQTFGKDGRLIRLAERVPLLNNLVQCAHWASGSEKQMRRAKTRNPLGENGLITQLAERIPLMADGIVCIHQFRGHSSEAEERARASSLKSMLSKDGVLIKLAELLPGSNVIAAMLHELRGNEEEAERALDLVRNWRKVGSPDGPLAKIAELVSGVDVILFGVMLLTGHYAHAVRTISKTRWIGIRAKSIVVVLSTDEARDWTIEDMRADAQITPRALSLPGGLVDLVLHFLDFHLKSARMRKGPPRLVGRPRLGSGALAHIVQRRKIAKGNEFLQFCLASLYDSVPYLVETMVELANWARHDWHRETLKMHVYRLLIPDMPNALYPSAACSLTCAVKASLASVTAHHQPFPKPHRHHVKSESNGKSSRSFGFPSGAALISCCASVGSVACGAHFGFLACCMAGCAVGMAALHRTVKSNLASWIDQINEASWEWMAAPVTPLAEQGDAADGSQCPQEVLDAASVPFPSAKKTHSTNSLASELSVGSIESLPPKHCDSRNVSAGAMDAVESNSLKQSERPTHASGNHGIVFEWPKDQVPSWAAREYILGEWYRWHWLGWLVWAFERPFLRRFLRGAFGGKPVQLAIPIPVPCGSSSYIWLPEIRVLLLIELDYKDNSWLRSIKAAMVDGMAEQILHAVRVQSLPKDLRDLDPKLKEFTHPIGVNCDIAFNWTAENRVELELQNLQTQLCLPQ